MAGPNPPKQPSSSSNNHRKSRWESSTSTPNKNSSTTDPKSSTKPNPSPKTRPSPSSAAQNKLQSDPRPPLPPFPFPDPAALGPPPPPAYGFHMLERRTIVLYDGSVRSYFALPPDYQDFPPRPPFLGPPDFGSSPLGFRDNRDYWNGPGEVPGPLKRKYGDEDRDLREEKKDELGRPKFGHHHNAKFYSLGQSGQDRTGTTSSPFRNDEMRASKYMRVGGGFENNNSSFGNKQTEVDQSAIKKAFLRFVKAVYENAGQKKNYLEDGKHGRIQCLACSRSSKDFPDMHGLVMHTYYSDNADFRVDHLGLHKALCVLMGWNYSKPPDNSKAYRFLPADEAAANQEDLIMWPPLVIVHNTITGKIKDDGRLEALGNKAMDSILRDLGFGTGKAKNIYGREGHLGITVVKFAGDQSGLKDAIRLAEYFEKEKRGRKDWSRLQPLTLGRDDEKNPALVKVDERTGEKMRIFYGYLGTVNDLDKVDFEMRKRLVIESRRDLKGPR